MKAVHFRLAKPHDLDGLVDLENECFTSDKMQRRHYRELLKKNSAQIIIAEHLNKIIGCAVILFRKNSSRARIYSLAVHSSYRGSGIAKKISSLIEEETKKRHCSEIVLEVRTNNTAAIRFYQKNGYEIFDTQTKFYEDGTDALRMRKKYDAQYHPTQ